MAELSRLQIETALKEIEDRYLEKDLVAAGEVKDIRIDGAKVCVDLLFGYPAKGYVGEVEAAVREHVGRVPGVASVEVGSKVQIVAHAVQRNLKPLAGIKNIIAVASGKAWASRPRPSTWRWRWPPRAPA